LAKKLARMHDLAHFDLDTIAWQPTDPPVRAPLSESEKVISDFMRDNPGWLFEGCYKDLLERPASSATHMIFLDLPVEICIENARARPWEPHKYASKAAQDKNLNMLIDWIALYENRDDDFSRRAHRSLYDKFQGHKARIEENLDDATLNLLLPTLSR